MMHERLVRLVRRLIRAQVRAWLLLAIIWGDYRAADKFRGWLADDTAQLYPPDELA
jgi:hypothetical protein